MAEKKKCAQKKECKDGFHTFFVTLWRTSGGRQEAVEIRCRHCLMPLSLEEMKSSEWRESEGI